MSASRRTTPRAGPGSRGNKVAAPVGAAATAERARRGGRAAPVLAVLAAALALVVGCSAAPPPVVGQVPPAPAPQIEPDPTQLRLGVDDLGAGFNPHRLAESTPASRAMAALVLPSVFRTGADGSPTLDTTVVTSTRVTETRPFTVSYEIAPAATWSDNAPVAAEDFVYLWQQMRSQPGVVGAAGYRAIGDVRSRAGGKAVDVVFDQPFPAWRTLFDTLLPAHLLKDAPGAWGGALTDSIPVSAGPFVVRVVDRIRGQVTLARNDRYWGTPAVPDEIVFQAAESSSLIDRVRGGDVSAAQFRADGTDLEALAAAGPGVVTSALPEPALVQLALRSDDGPLADIRVRRAVAAALDRPTLIAAGADGGPSAALRADAFATAPSAPGYRPTLPPDSPAATRDPSLTATLLSQAGYARGDDGVWARDGARLTLRLAAPAQVSPFGRLIVPLAAQLRALGIDSVVVADAGANPFPPGRGPLPTSTPASPSPGAVPTPGSGPRGAPPTVTTSPGPTSSTTSSGSASSSSTTTTVSPIPDSPSDMVVADLTVLAVPLGEDPITDLSSSVGCPDRRAPAASGVSPVVATTTTPTTSPSTNPAAPTSTSAAGSSTSAPDDLAEPEESEALAVSGWCDPTLQSLLDAAAAGATSRETALALAEPTLWSALPTIPLFQAASVLVGPTDRRDVVVGPLTTSPFAGAERWMPPPRSVRDDDGVN